MRVLIFGQPFEIGLKIRIGLQLASPCGDLGALGDGLGEVERGRVSNWRLSRLEQIHGRSTAGRLDAGAGIGCGLPLLYWTRPAPAVAGMYSGDGVCLPWAMRVICDGLTLAALEMPDLFMPCASMTEIRSAAGALSVGSGGSRAKVSGVVCAARLARISGGRLAGLT
ncbi:MAG: hypothetical protein MZV65_42790 [Chromatiales bacterium]|nr:hypothetical protein [Chromatiales bacterium]